MKKLSKHITLLIFFLSVISMMSCAGDEIKPEVDLTLEEENMPVQESWDSKVIFTEEGKLQGVLYSDHMREYKEPKEKLLDGVKIIFYNKEGKPTSQLTAKKGKIDELTQDMYAIDSVVAINDSSHVKLETDELMWRKKDEKIVTDKFVRITSDEEIIEGYGFESDQQIKNYVIRNVTYQTITQKKKNAK
ncbi:MAG: LPS export ABC transporter periplasmic protein LptC [Chlorobi bacterium]|nr:LPS export ABC transporter periplasmic protein LptC [Chlorobiota bacterium]